VRLDSLKAALKLLILLNQPLHFFLGFVAGIPLAFLAAAAILTLGLSASLFFFVAIIRKSDVFFFLLTFFLYRLIAFDDLDLFFLHLCFFGAVHGSLHQTWALTSNGSSTSPTMFRSSKIANWTLSP